MLKRQLSIIITCLSCLVISGCWDVKNLEKITFARGVAIDQTDDNKFLLTYQALLPSGSAKSEQQPGTASSYDNIQSTGTALLDAVSKVALSNPPIYSDHLKIFLFGEKVLQNNNLDAIINHFIRDDEIRRSCYLLLTEGDASDIFYIHDKAKIPVERMYELSENRTYNGEILKPLQLGDVAAYLIENKSFLMQLVSKKGQQLTYDGAGIISNKKFLGTISPLDVQSSNWILGNLHGGIVIAEHANKPVVFEINQQTSMVKPEIVDNQLTFHINLRAVGKIAEDQNMNENDFKSQYVKEIAHIVEEKVHAQVMDTMDVFQNKYQVDPLFLGDYIRIHYPKYWQVNKKNWERQFAKAKMDIHVSIDIENFGTKGSKKLVR